MGGTPLLSEAGTISISLGAERGPSDAILLHTGARSTNSMHSHIAQLTRCRR